jgi:acetylornithine deacetylase
MKSGTLTGLFVARILDDLGITLNGDLMVNAVTGEEDGGLGTMSTILHGYRPDAVVIPEPTHLDIAIASGGSLVYRITVTGKAAHGANRNAGVSAIEKFIPIFQDLLAWESERQQTVHHPLYDHYENKFPISTGTIRAGDWASTVPDKLVAEGRLGFIPGESLEDMMAATRQRITAVADQDDWLREHPPLVEFVSGQFIAEEIAPDHPLVQTVAAAHRSVVGSEALVMGLTGGADTRLWVRFAGVPALMYGPGTMDLAHQSDESVSIEDLLTCITVLTQATINWCGIATR